VQQGMVLTGDRRFAEAASVTIYAKDIMLAAGYFAV
jgi:hypothetical protein